MRAVRALLVAIAMLAIGSGCGDGSIGGDGGGGGGDGGGGGTPDARPGENEFTDGPLAEACRKIDLVIAVDGSSSMTEELAAMSDDVFPSLATALVNVSGGIESFRVGTLDACPDPANYHTRGETTGECNFSSGQVWIDSDSPNLVQEFSCVGDIFLDDQNCSGDNDDEQPASAAAASLEDPWKSGANAGFLRDDALLVVMAITDEDEQPTGAASTAQQVYDRLVATKGGVGRMVFLGIGGSTACTGFYGTAEQAVKLAQVTDLFIAEERGVWWDLCQGQLQDGLTEAIDVIEQACNDFPEVP